MKIFRKNQSLIILLGLILIAILITPLYTKVYSGLEKVSIYDEKDAETFIVTSLEDCNKSPNQNSCYKNIASAFAERFKPGLVLKVVAANEKRPDIFQSCHTVIHFFGQAVYKKEKDISRTLAAGDATCFAGYYHGALEGYFIEEDILSQVGDDASFADKIGTLCSQSSEKQHNECLHGLGHALMFATDSDVPRALTLCDKVPQERAGWCYSGVFMENSNSSTSKDHPSKYFKKDDPKYPCLILEEKYLSACYTIQSQYVVGENNGDWQKSFIFCSTIPSIYSMDCYRAIGTSIAGYSQDSLNMKNSCELANDISGREECVKGVVGALVQRYNDPFERTAQFCSLFSKETKEVKTCYRETIGLIQRYGDSKKDCLNVSDVFYQKMCLEGL